MYYETKHLWLDNIGKINGHAWVHFGFIFPTKTLYSQAVLKQALRKIYPPKGLW